MKDDQIHWRSRFIDRLCALAPIQQKDKWERDVLAQLRHGLGKDDAYVLLHVGQVFNGVPDMDLADAVLVACLFAAFPEAHGDASVGAAFQELTESESRTKRFVALVDSSREDLPGRLRHAVKLLKAKDVESLGWGRLLADLALWNHESRCVQKRWSRDYWREERTERAEVVTVTESANP